MTELERVTELEIIKNELELLIERMDNLIQDWKDSLRPKQKKYPEAKETLGRSE